MPDNRLWEDTPFMVWAKRALKAGRRHAWPLTKVFARRAWTAQGKLTRALVRATDDDIGALKLLVAAFALVLAGVFSILWLVPRAVTDAQEAELAGAACKGPLIVTEAKSDLHVRPIGFSRTAETVQQGQRLILCSELGVWLGVVIDDPARNCFNPDDPARKLIDGKCQTGWIRAREVWPASG